MSTHGNTAKSSSSGSPDRKRRREEGPSVDWFDHGEDSFIEKNHIYQTLPLAWTENSIRAAHCLRDGADDVNTRLWHVPNGGVPPRPTFVDFVCICASAKLKQNESSGKIGKGGHYGVVECESNSMSDDDSSSQDSVSVDGSAYRELKQEYKRGTCKSYATKCQSNKDEHDSRKQEYKRMQLCCDESAALALATISEECMISSLLPFARQHVSRCRRGNSVTLETNSKYHDQFYSTWTLPVEEAIVNMSASGMASSGSKTCIPSSHCSSLNLKVTHDSLHCLPSLHDQLGGKKTKGGLEEKRKRTKHTEQWCKKNNIQLDFVSDNRDLFHPILGHIYLPKKKPEEEGQIDRIQNLLEASIEGRDVESEFSIPKIIVSKRLSTRSAALSFNR